MKPNKLSRMTILIPAICGICILQLIFRWLLEGHEPPCKSVVYGFGTFLTVTSPLISCITYSAYGLRRSFSVVVSSSVLEAIAVIVSALLLAFQASARTAFYVMTIFSLIYAIFIVGVLLTVIMQAPVDPAPPVPHESRPYRNDDVSYVDTDYSDCEDTMEIQLQSKKLPGKENTHVYL